MILPPAERRPFGIVETEEVGRVWRLGLRRQVLRLEDGAEKEVAIIQAPPAAVMVPVFDDGSTVLVRQWRPGWDESSWEAPAGTVEDGEEPLECAKRELAEEAGLRAGDWDALGTARGTAVSTVVFHLFLARRLEPAPTALEDLEQDLVTHRLPLTRALEAARSGEIQHSLSIVALWRAAVHLGIS